MPYRLDVTRSKIQFVAPANFPVLINKAAAEHGVPSQTRYIQLALCRQLSEDLGIPYEDLVESLPPTVTTASVLFGDDRKPLRRVEAPRIGR